MQVSHNVSYLNKGSNSKDQAYLSSEVIQAATKASTPSYEGFRMLDAVVKLQLSMFGFKKCEETEL